MTPRQIHITAKTRRKQRDFKRQYGFDPLGPTKLSERTHLQVHGFYRRYPV